MIQSIEIPILRNAEYLEFSNSVLAIVFKYNKNLLKVNEEHAALETVIREIESLFKVYQGSKLTPVIEALDLRRDSLFTGLYKYVDAHTHHYEAPKQEAAVLLMSQLNVYGNISSVTVASLPAETAILKSLVNDFTDKPAFKPAVEQLALLNWVIELGTVNEQLAQKYMERTHELGIANPNNIKDKRVEANARYYDLRDMLVAQAKVAKNVPPFNDAINDINALIDQYNVMLAGRAPVKDDPATTAAAEQ